MILLLAGCLINDAVYDQRKYELTDHDGDGFVFEADCDDENELVFPGGSEVCNEIDDDCDGAVDNEAADVSPWFEDADGDGHGNLATKVWGCAPDPGFVASDDDCDDSAAGTHPGAADDWYDGVDSNCDNANDFDADGDGDDALEYGGTDCAEDDVSVAGTLSEGWYDGGVDNNCDGSIEDQAVANLGDIATRIDGPAENAAFGSTILAVPAGWIDDEAVLLVGAPFSGSGSAFGWRASELTAAPTLENASWVVSGREEAEYTGYGMGWAGNADEPLVAVSSEGADGGHGRVAVWTRDSWGDSPPLSIFGEAEAGYFGGAILSDHDHNGDGVCDLVVTAPADSREATNAGVAFVFLDPSQLSGIVGAEAADLVFSNRYPGSFMEPIPLGDATKDGTDDLAFYLNLTFEEGPAALLIAGDSGTGPIDVEDASFAQFYAAGHAISTVSDWDDDGIGEILVADGGVGRYSLPLSGHVTPWDNAASRLMFADPSESVSGVVGGLEGFVGTNSVILMAAAFGGSRGFISIEHPYWDESARVDDARFVALGEAAGDAFGNALAHLDADADSVEDLVVGAPGVDETAPGAGSVYVIAGPK